MGMTLFILVEGNDDERFFDNVVKQLFRDRYCMIKLVKYAHRRRKEIANLLKSATRMRWDYIYVRDLNDAPCVTARKRQVRSQFRQMIPVDNIIIVVKEIEGWYVAGVNDATARRLHIRGETGTTNGITKEEFAQLIPRNMSRIEFMQEILKCYDLEGARGKNRSFAYFLDKWIVEANRAS